MDRQIDKELQVMRDLIVAMGKIVEKSIEEATQGLIERKPERLDSVRALEDSINNFQVEVDERCLQMMASQSPLAADLRMMLAMLKINSDLERMGDQAMNISHWVRDYLEKDHLPQEKNITVMAGYVRKMVADSLQAFVHGDLALSENVLLQDDQIDAGKHQVIRELIDLMKKKPESIEASIDLMNIARNLERLGDHATNIAEDVIFASTGKDIRHGGFAP